MRDADRQDQERHQNRERIKPEAGKPQQAQFPDHGSEGGEQRQQCESQRAAEYPQQRERRQQRDREKNQYFAAGIADIADHLGEADDANVDLVSLVMRADCFERSEEHTSELKSLMRISYAVFCLKNKKKHKVTTTNK